MTRGGEVGARVVGGGGGGVAGGVDHRKQSSGFCSLPRVRRPTVVQMERVPVRDATESTG